MSLHFYFLSVVFKHFVQLHHFGSPTKLSDLHTFSSFKASTQITHSCCCFFSGMLSLNIYLMDFISGGCESYYSQVKCDMDKSECNIICWMLK